jgi:hypothetical protein
MAFCVVKTGWASTTREPSTTQESRVGSKVGWARSAPVGVAPRRRSSSSETATRSGFPHSTAISSLDAWPSPALRASRPDGTRPRSARPCTSRGWSRSRRKDRHHRAKRAARRSRHRRSRHRHTRRRARPSRVSRPCASVVRFVELVRDRSVITRPALGMLPLQEERRCRPVRRSRASDQRYETSFGYGV